MITEETLQQHHAELTQQRAAYIAEVERQVAAFDGALQAISALLARCADDQEDGAPDGADHGTGADAAP